LNKEGDVFGPEGDQYKVIEPCNYSSNLAFYHSSTRLCNYPQWTLDEKWQMAAKRAASTLAVGSAWWHGSQTYLGSVFDNDMIKIVTYACAQAAVAWTDSPILTYWSTNKTYKHSLDIITELTEIIAEEPVYNWTEKISSLEYPYARSMMAFNLNVAYLVFPYWITEIIVQIASENPFFGEPTEEEIKFWNEIWLPELHDKLKDVDISFEDSIVLATTFISFFTKVILAMCM